jgi:hypothetical protein
MTDMTNLVPRDDDIDELEPTDASLIHALYTIADDLRRLAYQLEVALHGRDAVTGLLREVSAADPQLPTSDMIHWQRVTARGIADEARARLRKLRNLTSR